MKKLTIIFIVTLVAAVCFIVPTNAMYNSTTVVMEQGISGNVIPNESKVVIEYLNGLLKKSDAGSFQDYFYSIGLTGMAFLNSTSVNIDAVKNANQSLPHMPNGDEIQCTWKIVGKKRGSKFHYTIYYAQVNVATLKLNSEIDCFIYDCDNKKTKTAKTTVIEQSYRGSDMRLYSSYSLAEVL